MIILANVYVHNSCCPCVWLNWIIGSLWMIVRLTLEGLFSKTVCNGYIRVIYIWETWMILITAEVTNSILIYPWPKP